MLSGFVNRERKRGLELSVSRTPQQEAEETAILEQAATIQAARKAEQAQLQAQRKAAAPPPAGLSLQPDCVPDVDALHCTLLHAKQSASHQVQLTATACWNACRVVCLCSLTMLPKMHGALLAIRQWHYLFLEGSL